MHVGEVSWLKAAIFEDPETFVPDTIGKISELLPDFHTITPELIEQFDAAFELPNTSSYGIKTAKRERVREFLEKHAGEQAFTVSW